MSARAGHLRRMIDCFDAHGPALLKDDELDCFVVVDERDTLAGATKFTDRLHARDEYDRRFVAYCARRLAA